MHTASRGARHRQRDWRCVKMQTGTELTFKLRLFLLLILEQPLEFRLDLR